MKVKELIQALIVIDQELDIMLEDNEYGFFEASNLILDQKQFYRNDQQEDISWSSNISNNELDHYMGKYLLIHLI